MAGRLRGCKAEFDAIEDDARGHEQAVGSSVVADALSRFAANWSDKRKEISEHLETVSGYAAQAAETYDATETAVSDGTEQFRDALNPVPRFEPPRASGSPGEPR